MVTRDNMLVLPVVESGIQLLEGKVVNLLAKLEALDIEGAIQRIGDAAEAGKVALENSEEVLTEAFPFHRPRGRASHATTGRRNSLSAFSVVWRATAATSLPDRSARNVATWRTKAGSFRRPRFGAGAR